MYSSLAYLWCRKALLSSIDETLEVARVGRCNRDTCIVIIHSCIITGCSPVLFFFSLSFLRSFVSSSFPSIFISFSSSFPCPYWSFINRGYVAIYPWQADIRRVSLVLKHLVNKKNNILSPIHDTVPYYKFPFLGLCDDDW